MGTVPSSSFKVKIVKKNGFMHIGLAPHEGIKLEGGNHRTRGWHLGCKLGSIYSQQGEKGKNYVNKWGLIKEGSVIEVVLAEAVVGGTKVRKISFVIDGKDYGVAFDNIPSEVGDLYPCVHLYDKGDSVEII